MDLGNEWYTTQEVSEILDIDVQAIRRDIRLGLITNVKEEKRRIFIHKDVVFSMLEEKDTLKDYCTMKEVAETLGKTQSAVRSMISRNTIKTSISYRDRCYISKQEVDLLMGISQGTIRVVEASRKYGLILMDVVFLAEVGAVKAERVNSIWYINRESLDKFIKKVQSDFGLSKSSDITKTHLKASVSGVSGIKVEEAAEILEIAPNTLRGYIRNGEVKAERIGEINYIPESEIQKFFNTPEGIKKRYYNSDEVYKMYSEIMECIISSNKIQKETLKMFRMWAMTKLTKSTGNIATKRMKVTKYINTAKALAQYLNKEFWEYDEVELDLLRSNITMANVQNTLNQFYTHIQTVKECKTDTNYKIQKINSEDSHAEKKENKYSGTEFKKIKEYLMDIDLHIEKAKNDKFYAQSWLYCTLHLSLAWRSKDFLQLASVPVEDILGCEIEKINLSEITHTQAQKVINSFIKKCIPIAANKNGVQAHIVVVPQVLIGTAVAICVNEMHRKKEGWEKMFYYKNMRNSEVSKIFPDDFPAFENRKANKSKMTYSFLTAANKRGRAELAYSLQSYARSHKIKVSGAANQVTATYLELDDTISDAKKIGKHLFDRGVFGWQIELMLEMLNEKHEDTLELRTSRIKTLRKEFTPLVVEGMASHLNTMSKQAEELVDELILLDLNEIRTKLLKIAEFKSPGLLKNTQCIKEVSNCPYLEGESKCLGCKYNIPTNYVLEIVNARLMEAMTLLENTPTTDVVKRAKYTHIIRKLLFIIMDFRRSSKELGDDYLTSFIDLKKLKRRYAILEKDKFLTLGSGDK